MFSKCFPIGSIVHIPNENIFFKVEAVVKSLIKIRSEDSEAKSLVFSTWTGDNFLWKYQDFHFSFSAALETFFSHNKWFFRRVGHFGSGPGWEQHPLRFIAQQVGAEHFEQSWNGTFPVEPPLKATSRGICKSSRTGRMWRFITNPKKLDPTSDSHISKT